MPIWSESGYAPFFYDSDVFEKSCARCDLWPGQCQCTKCEGTCGNLADFTCDGAGICKECDAATPHGEVDHDHRALPERNTIPIDYTG